MSRIGALDLRDAVLDEGSFRSWDSPPLEVDAGEAYRGELAAACAATGLDEAVVTGEGSVFGRRVALVACEFDFLAGSIGVAAAERITAAVQRATAERLPLLASPSSGGTRMQEGTVAFLQMVKIAAAVESARRATENLRRGKSYVVYPEGTRSPTGSPPPPIPPAREWPPSETARRWLGESAWSREKRCQRGPRLRVGLTNSLQTDEPPGSSRRCDANHCSITSLDFLSAKSCTLSSNDLSKF